MKPLLTIPLLLLYVSCGPRTNEKESINNTSLKGDVVEDDNLPHLSQMKTFDKGKTYFKENCSSCHVSNADPPIIENVLNRVPNMEWLKLYLTNEDTLLMLNDPYTISLNEEYGNRPTQHQFELDSSTFEALKLYLKYYGKTPQAEK